MTTLRLLPLFLALATPLLAAARPTNIVFFLADDLGQRDLDGDDMAFSRSVAEQVARSRCMAAAAPQS